MTIPDVCYYLALNDAGFSENLSGFGVFFFQNLGL